MQIEELLKKAVDVLVNEFKEELISVVFYGSRARGEGNLRSDIDLFIVLNDIKNFIEMRRRIYSKLNSIIKNVEISPLIFDKTSASKLAPIHFELSADGIIIFDKEEFMKNILDKTKKLIEKIGAKRYKTKDGGCGWILKEDIKKGEIIELEI